MTKNSSKPSNRNTLIHLVGATRASEIDLHRGFRLHFGCTV